MEKNAVIDTGAEVTVISDRLYESLPPNNKPVLTKAKRGLVVADANRAMKTNGIAKVTIVIGDNEFQWPVYVAPIRDEILLGCDIIDEKDITLNTKKGISINGEWLKCDVKRATDCNYKSDYLKTPQNVKGSSGAKKIPSKYTEPKSKGQPKVKVSRSVTIPANSVVTMYGSCEGLDNKVSENFLFEKTEDGPENILIARAVVEPTSGRVPVKLINLDSSPLHIEKGRLLGVLHNIDAIHPIDMKAEPPRTTCSTADQREKEKQQSNICRIEDQETEKKLHSEANKTAPNVPAHLKEMYEESIKNLPKEHHMKLASLLEEYGDVFAKSKSDLGKCSVLKHHIDTGDAAPVKQPLRRTPQQYEGEEEKYVREQLEAGTIYPSKSPWSSPLVMVRKKTGEVRVCIDYRRVNERTVKDAYPLPRIDMCLDCLSNAKIFSTIDLQSAYMQLSKMKKLIIIKKIKRAANLYVRKRGKTQGH